MRTKQTELAGTAAWGARMHSQTHTRRWQFSRVLAGAVSILVVLGFFSLCLKQPLLQREDPNDDKVITTRRGAQAVRTLPDGSVARLNTATRVEVQYDSRHRRIKLAEGEVLLTIANGQRQPFIVDMAGREVRARNATMLLRDDALYKSVMVHEGTAEVVVRSTPFWKRPISKLVQAGQRIRFFDNETLVDTPSWQQVSAWQKNIVALDDTPLDLAVYEMNRYSDVRLSIIGQIGTTLRVSGTFQTGDSCQFAEVVAAAFGLKASRRGNQITLKADPSSSTHGLSSVHVAAQMLQ